MGSFSTLFQLNHLRCFDGQSHQITTAWHLKTKLVNLAAVLLFFQSTDLRHGHHGTRATTYLCLSIEMSKSGRCKEDSILQRIWKLGLQATRRAGHLMHREAHSSKERKHYRCTLLLRRWVKADHVQTQDSRANFASPSVLFVPTLAFSRVCPEPAHAHRCCKDTELFRDASVVLPRKHQLWSSGGHGCLASMAPGVVQPKMLASEKQHRPESQTIRQTKSRQEQRKFLQDIC